ncbi:MAG: hypothetical protein ACYSTZ_03410 [Planctomycetota bacterium]
MIRFNFIDWRPDADDFGNKGLTVADNVVHDSEGYKQSKTGGNTLLSDSLGYYKGFFEANPTGGPAFAETNSLWHGLADISTPGGTVLQVRAGQVGNWGDSFTTGTAPVGATSASLQAYCATEVPGDAFLVTAKWAWNSAGGQGSTSVASGISTFATDYGTGLGWTDLPNSAAGVCCGVINQFACVGNDGDALGFIEKRVTFRWSAIGDASDWPTPGTDDARSKQAGQQIFNPKFGRITGIASGDFFGYVFQDHAITKVTYVGGDVVFMFDTFEEVRGCGYLNRLVQVDDRVYYESKLGRHILENSQVADIGYGRVDDSYPPDTTDGKRLYKNPGDHIVFFSNSIVYNYKTDQFTRLPNITPAFDVDKEDGLIGQWANNGTTAGYIYDATGGTAETATITTGETDINEGGRAVVTGARPLITGGTTTVRVGKRDTLADSVTWSTSTSLNSRTKMANFRDEARYHRAEFSITGGFTQALGADVEFTPSGKV